MKIKICTKNWPALEAALLEVNGRATAHTLDRSTLLEWVASAEARLAELGIPKLARRGATARRTSGGGVPHSYRYPRLRTTATIERGATDWYLVALHTAETFEKRGGDLIIKLTENQSRRTIAHLAATGVSLSLPKQEFTQEEQTVLLEAARVGLSDADNFDSLADHLDLADEYLIALREKLQLLLAQPAGGAQ